MWAPWRMEYILSPKDKDAGARPGCIFCNFPATDPRKFRENLVLVANARYVVMLNRYPFAAGHVMVIPRRHVALLQDLAPDEADELFRAVREVGAQLRAHLAPQGINFGINEGSAAGAGIADHLHVHLVPRWHGDTNFMAVVADLRVMPEHLDATFLRLYPAIAHLPGAAPAP